MWLLKREPRSSGKAVSTLKHLSLKPLEWALVFKGCAVLNTALKDLFYIRDFSHNVEHGSSASPWICFSCGFFLGGGGDKPSKLGHTPQNFH